MGDVNTVKVTVVSLSAAANIVLNSLVMAVILRTPSLRDDRTSLFMFSLATSSLAFGVCCSIGSAIMCSHPALNTATFNTVYIIIAGWFTVASLYNLCCVSLCKMAAVVYPLRYLAAVTERRCYLVILFNWTISIALAAPFAFNDVSWSQQVCYPRRNQVTGSSSNYLYVVQVIGGLLPMFGMIYSNVRMFIVVARVNRQVAAAGFPVEAGSNAVETSQPSLASALIRSVRSSRNIIIICVTYVFLVIIIILVVSAKSADHTVITNDVEFAIIWLFFANTFINSFLYIVLHRSVRMAVMNLLHSQS